MNAHEKARLIHEYAVANYHQYNSKFKSGHFRGIKNAIDILGLSAEAEAIAGIVIHTHNSYVSVDWVSRRLKEIDEKVA